MSSNEIVLKLNLRDVKKASRRKRAPYAVRLIKRLVARYVKVDVNKVKIGNGLNEFMWSRGIQKPPSKVKVKVTKREDGTVLVEYQG